MKTNYAEQRENAEASCLSPAFLPQKRPDSKLNAATVLKATVVNAPLRSVIGPRMSSELRLANWRINGDFEIRRASPINHQSNRHALAR